MEETESRRSVAESPARPLSEVADILALLKEVEIDASVDEVCKRAGISVRTLHRWWTAYGHDGPREAVEVLKLKLGDTRQRRPGSNAHLESEAFQAIKAGMLRHRDRCSTG